MREWWVAGGCCWWLPRNMLCTIVRHSTARTSAASTSPDVPDLRELLFRSFFFFRMRHTKSSVSYMHRGNCIKSIHVPLQAPINDIRLDSWSETIFATLSVRHITPSIYKRSNIWSCLHCGQGCWLCCNSFIHADWHKLWSQNITRGVTLYSLLMISNKPESETLRSMNLQERRRRFVQRHRTHKWDPRRPGWWLLFQVPADQSICAALVANRSAHKAPFVYGQRIGV